MFDSPCRLIWFLECIPVHGVAYGILVYMTACNNCATPFFERHQVKFCSNKCQADFQYRVWIDDWKKGKVTGNIGLTTKNISGHLKRYLGEKFYHQCSACKWSKRHPITGAIPLEIDHIDGNAENNLESNLRLLCPNCHALTPFYKNLNKGKGRKWRMKKYMRNPV